MNEPARLDRPALRPLPALRYGYAEWRTARVNIDYHIQVVHAFYSVPQPLRRCEVDVRITVHTVEIFHKHRTWPPAWPPPARLPPARRPSLTEPQMEPRRT